MQWVSLAWQSRRRYSASRKKVENLVLRIIQAGVREGSFAVDDAAETNRALLGMCQSIVRWYRPGGALTPERVAARYVAIALNTVGADPVTR